MKHTLLARACCLFLTLFAAGGLAHATQGETAGDRTQEEIQNQFREDMTKVEALIVVDRDLERAHARLVELIGALAEQAGEGVSADLVEALSQLVIEETLEGKELGAAGQDPLAVLATMAQTASFKPTGDVLVPSQGEAGDEERQVSQDRMESMVRDAIRSGGGLMDELGSVAGPTLAKIVEADIGFFPAGVGFDPLYHLMRVDPLRAGALITTHIEEGGVFFGKRAARAAKYAALFSSENLSKHPGQTPLITALEAMLRDPLLRDSVQDGFKDYASSQVMIPSMVEFLVLEIESESEPVRSRAMSSLSSRTTHLANVSMFEGLLDSKFEDVRSFAAARLVMADVWSPVLADLAADPSVTVRRHVAHMLRGKNSRTKALRPIKDVQGFLALFDVLAFDADALVRATATQSLDRLARSRAWTPEYVHGNSNFDKAEVFRHAPSLAAVAHLGRDSNSDVSELLLKHLGGMPVEICEDLIPVLMHDHQSSHGLWRAISRLCPRSRPKETASVFYAVAGSIDPRSWDRTMWDNLQAALRDQPGGNEILLQTIVRGTDPVVGAQLLRETQVEVFGKVSAETFKASIRLLDGAGESRPILWDILKSIPESPILIDTARHLASDDSVGDETRFWASLALHRVDVDKFVSGVQAGLASTWWREGGQTDADLNKLLYDLMPIMRDDQVALEAVSLALIRDPSTNLHVVGAFARESMNQGSAATSKAILQELATEEAGEQLVRDALQQMVHFPDQRDDDQLKHAVRSGREGLAAAAADVIGRLHDPALLPLLVECVEGYPGKEPWTVAVRASVGFLSDDAAQLLLRAAELATSDSQRLQCFRQLDVLRDFSVARDYWRRNQIAKHERTSVVSELLSMLSTDQSDEVRIEAARGLATYRAEEAIPDLIRLLQGTSDPVRKAAKQALDRINEPGLQISKDKSGDE